MPEPGREPVLSHGDNRIVRVGETLTVEGPIRCCERGLHASKRAIDAISFRSGTLACRVRLSGEIVERPDKCAASARTVLWMADADRCLRLFAIWCAREALEGERARGREPDPRSWRALDVAEAYLAGKASKEEMRAAADAAAAAAAAYAADAARSVCRGRQNANPALFPLEPAAVRIDDHLLIAIAMEPFTQFAQGRKSATLLSNGSLRQDSVQIRLGKNLSDPPIEGANWWSFDLPEAFGEEHQVADS